MQNFWRNTISSIALISLCAAAQAAALPSDVRPGHWAAKYVQEAINNGILSTQPDGQFHGEAKVTHKQAVIAIAKLAECVEKGSWHKAPSQPVPLSVVPSLEQGGWQQRPVTRYMLASVLARFGGYLTNGISRAPVGSKETGKSEALSVKPAVKLPTADPAYSALTYLVDRRMLWSDSPLLTADNQPVKGSEVSKAVTEMVAGLNDRLTEIGLDADGSTPDPSFHKKKN